MNKNKNPTLLVFIIMNFVLAMTAMVFNGILDQVAISLNVPISKTGLLITMYAYGAAIGVPITLILFRNIERSRMLKIMLLITILMSFAIVFVDNFNLLLVVRLVMGISANSYGVLAISTVIALSPKERQGRAMALLIMGNSLALVIGVPMTRLLSGILDWTSIFWILNVIMILSLMVFQALLPVGDHESTKLVLKNQLEYLKDGKIAMILLFTFIMFISIGAFYTYITPYFILSFPSIEGRMSLVLFLLGLVSFIGNLIGGHVSDRYGYSKSMMLGGSLQLVLMTIIFFTRTSMLFNVVFVLIWMMSVWFTGLQLNNGIAHETNNKSSFILSLNGSAVQMGSAVGSSIAALVIDTSGIMNIIFIALFASMGIVIIRLFSFRKYEFRQIVSSKSVD